MKVPGEWHCFVLGKAVRELALIQEDGSQTLPLDGRMAIVFASIFKLPQSLIILQEGVH